MKTNDELVAAMKAIARGYRTDAVYRVEVDAKSFAVASDGHVLLAVDGAGYQDVLADAPGAVLKISLEQCPRETPTEGVVDAAALAEFAGVRQGPQPVCARCQGKGEVPCTDCDGDGEEECECRCGHVHEAVCDECDGDGTVECPSCTPAKNQPARLCGGVVNRALVRVVLEAVGVCEGRLAVEAIAKNGGMLYRLTPVDGNSWWALIMSMRPDTRTSVEFEKPETWKDVAA
jgi:hypothetical protein